MQNKEFGFILKRFLPYKKKLSVLSNMQGKINIITQPIDKLNLLWPGMLICFNSTFNNTKMQIASNVEIMINPIQINTQNFYWMHHILEICYYFVSLDDPCSEIFNFLYSFFSLIKIEKQFSKNIFIINKIYLIKLLCLIGFYPEKELLGFLNVYDQIRSNSIDFNNYQQVESLTMYLDKISLLYAKKIDKWALSCLSTHPCFKLFKTIKNFYI